MTPTEPPGEPTPTDGGPGETDPGWAAPGLPPREPADTSAGAAPGEPTPATPPPPTTPLPPVAPAAPAAPPPGTPPGARPRKRRVWLVVLLAVLGVGLVAAIAGTVLFVENTKPPYDAAEDFLDLVRLNQRERAASSLCAADRDDASSALDNVKETYSGGKRLIVNVLGVDVDGDRAWVEYEIELRFDDGSRTYRLPLVKEGGDWRPCPGSGIERV